MTKDFDEAEMIQPFQLIRLRKDALALMERAALIGRDRLGAPESHAATARSAARLARIWAWAAARRKGDSESAMRALNGAEPGELDSAAAPDCGCRFVVDVEALAQRALRLEALYKSPQDAQRQ